MSGERTTILVAGDSSGDLESLTARLAADGFKVLPVEERASIVMFARSEVPSLILLDLKSCFDICRMLKRNFVTEPIPIIALLSPAEEVDRIVTLELGADDCMAKPFNFGELTLRIKRSLDRAHDKKGKARYTQSKHYSALARSSHGAKSKGAP